MFVIIEITLDIGTVITWGFRRSTLIGFFLALACIPGPGEITFTKSAKTGSPATAQISARVPLAGGIITNLWGYSKMTSFMLTL